MNFPNFSELSKQLETDVYELCLPAGRMVGTQGHQVAETFLLRRLNETGCVPYRGNSVEIPYVAEAFMASGELGQHEFTNLIGVIPGSNRELPPILVGAHYDSVIEAPCADDNGAAVAICLSIAKAAAEVGGLERDLIVAIFDAEEPPYFCTPSMGSIRFYEDQLDKRGVHFALIFDLVGHDVSVPDEYRTVLAELIGPMASELPFEMLHSLLFMMGAESHPDLPRVVSSAVTGDLKLIATLNEYIGDMSDHGVFRRNGVPYLFFSCGRWEHYHRVSDTPEKLNYEKMARITMLSGDILQRAAKESLSGSSSEDHSLSFEVQKLKDTLGIALPFLLQYLGMSQLESRADVKQVVDAVKSLGV